MYVKHEILYLLNYGDGLKCGKSYFVWKMSHHKDSGSKCERFPTSFRWTVRCQTLKIITFCKRTWCQSTSQPPFLLYVIVYTNGAFVSSLYYVNCLRFVFNFLNHLNCLKCGLTMGMSHVPNTDVKCERFPIFSDKF